MHVEPLPSRWLPFRHIPSPREAVRQFTPNWFTVNMGTGILFLMLLAFPFPFVGQVAIAHTLWLVDMVLYLVFSLLFVARLTFFRETVRPMLAHSVQPMFLGAIPMGLIPIINGMVPFGSSLFGAHAYDLALVLWWVDAALAMLFALLVPYWMFIHQEHSLDRMSAVWLLPIVSPEVTASSAGTLAPHFSAQTAQVLIGLSYIMWGVSVLLALSIITILVLRLALHKLPHRDMAASAWLPLGPIGTGALGLMTLGQAAPVAFAGTSLLPVALLARDGGLLVAVVMWGFGFWWLLMALLFTLRYREDGMSFNMGWWGFTFPLGVYTAATLTLFHLSGFALFKYVGAVQVVLLLVFWIMVMSRTLRGAWQGHLFRAPCLNANTTPVLHKQKD